MTGVREESRVETINIDLGNGVTQQMVLGGHVTTTRKCGSCSLCCKLLPVRELGKLGNQKCRHSRHREGGACTIYHDADKLPESCRLWSCRWLLEPSLSLPRPDRSHYVIDILPDWVRVTEDDKVRQQPVLQIWCDPGFPNAWRTPACRAFIERQARESGMITIIRYSENPEDGLSVIPPSMTVDHEWLEIPCRSGGPTSHENITAAIMRGERTKGTPSNDR